MISAVAFQFCEKINASVSLGKTTIVVQCLLNSAFWNALLPIFPKCKCEEKPLWKKLYSDIDKDAGMQHFSLFQIEGEVFLQ